MYPPGCIPPSSNISSDDISEDEEEPAGSPTMNVCTWTFKCISVAEDHMSKFNFPDDQNAIMEMCCKNHLKGTWPVTPNHSRKHPELMR
eukprot:8785709-Karenia_brevis.AAC.1